MRWGHEPIPRRSSGAASTPVGYARSTRSRAASNRPSLTLASPDPSDIAGRCCPASQVGVGTESVYANPVRTANATPAGNVPRP
jgi:hypothetical protein